MPDNSQLLIGVAVIGGLIFYFTSLDSKDNAPPAEDTEYWSNIFDEMVLQNEGKGPDHEDRMSGEQIQLKRQHEDFQQQASILTGEWNLLVSPVIARATGQNAYREGYASVEEFGTNHASEKTLVDSFNTRAKQFIVHYD